MKSDFADVHGSGGTSGRGKVVFRPSAGTRACVNAVDLHADCQRAGFQGQLGFGTSAALELIDMARAYFDTSLAATLTALRFDTLIITGISTSGCVRATGLDACQNGFIPITVRGAVGDRDQRVHEANLFDLNAKYADVVSEADVIEYLAKK